MSRHSTLFYCMFFSLMFLIGCQKDENPNAESTTFLTSVSEVDNNIAIDWIDVYLEVEKDLSGFRPAATSRALGYISAAVYQAAQPGMTSKKSLADLMPEAKLPVFPNDGAYNWEVVINECYNATMVHFLNPTEPNHSQIINDTYDNWTKELTRTVDTDVYERSKSWGILIANTIIKYANSDVKAIEQVSNPRPNSYTTAQGLGIWQVPNGNALFPYWGEVRTFFKWDLESFVLPPFEPSLDPTSDFYNEALEVNTTVSNLTQKDRWVAEFWSDDIVGLTFSPPARNFAIAEQLVTQENMNLEEALFFFMKLGLSTNDASVLCWYGKYQYNIIRPQEFIQEHINPQFKTILGEAVGLSGINPPFPAYPSGHSTFASAGAGIFIEEFGNSYAFTDRCHEGRTEFLGNPRSYISFTKMAEENAYSRIPLGVHFRMDCTEGLRIGWEVSNRVNEYFE